MKIRPWGVPTMEVISTSVDTDRSVAYILMSLRLLWGMGETERPMRRTETGVHNAMREDISSTNTAGFGVTTAT